jgi:membrane dipeptidase
MSGEHALGTLLPDALVWDNHACMPLEADCAHMGELGRCRGAGIDIVSLNISSGDLPSAQALPVLAAFRAWVNDHSEHYVLIGSAAEARQAKASGRLGVCFDIEGMTALDGDPEMVGRYYELGVRWMLSAYNHANLAGGGCLDDDDGGLTAFGRAVVREMNRAGMVVCGSHAGERTALELIDASQAPVIFSHSNPRAVWDSPRNIGDPVMRACAARGGVVGLNGIGAFLGRNDTRIETFVRHVRYAIDLIGEDHVGIALDYCFGMENAMVDFALLYPRLFPLEHGYQQDGLRMIAPWQLSQVAETLLAAGMQARTLGKLFGGNHLRIAQTVWR